MPESREKLAVNNANSLKTSKIYLDSTAPWYVLSKLLLIGRDFLFLYTVLVLLLKSIFFIGVVNNDNAANFNLLKGFHSYQAPPSMVTYLSFLIVIFSFSFLLKNSLQFWYHIILNGLISLLMVGDLMYYRGFGSFLSPYLLSQSSNFENLFASIVSMLRPIDALLFIDLLLLIVFNNKLVKYYQYRKRRILIFFFFLLFSVSTITYQHYRLDVLKTGDDMLFRVAWVPNQTMTNLSPVGYHVYDLYNYYKDNKSYELKPEEREEIRQWFMKKDEQLSANKFKGLLKDRNLIVIQVESLENFVIDRKVNNQEITPNINQLLKNSLYFSNFYEQVNNGNSSDADLMTNTSVYPVRSGATFFRFPMNTYNSLPKLFEEKGYTTLGIHPDKGSYWNWMQALNSIGFDKTIDVSYFDQSEKIGLGLSDGSYFSQVAPLLIKQDQPFYAFMVTLSSHSPFDLPSEYQDLKLEDALNSSKLGGYFQSLRYTDREIGRFLNTLEENKLLENTVIVIYGDHTGVHKYYNDEIKQLKQSEEWWLDESKRIPFIIYSKGLQEQKLNVTGGQVDILPTLAYLFDLDESYKRTAVGRNLLNTKKDFAILANRDYMGTYATDSEKEFFTKGIDISELILKSNFFKIDKAD